MLEIEKKDDQYIEHMFLGKAGQPIPIEGISVKQAEQIMETAVEYKELRMMYACALKEIRTKFDVLNTEFNVRYQRNPINFITTRVKSTHSILEKMHRLKAHFTLRDVEDKLNDIAGVRVICSYVDDIYRIASALTEQDDIKLLQEKDYISNPKPNGYRSLHLIVSVPVFFADHKRDMRVEVQIRTIAMDFWASLEHQMKYKRSIPDQQEISEGLRGCADVIARTDREMLALRRRIEAAEDLPSEDDELFDRLKKLDIQIG